MTIQPQSEAEAFGNGGVVADADRILAALAEAAAMLDAQRIPTDGRLLMPGFEEYVRERLSAPPLPSDDAFRYKKPD